MHCISKSLFILKVYVQWIKSAINQYKVCACLATWGYDLASGLSDSPKTRALMSHRRRISRAAVLTFVFGHVFSRGCAAAATAADNVL